MGKRYVQSRRDQLNGRMNGVSAHTRTGADSIAARASHDRDVNSATAIPCRA